MKKNIAILGSTGSIGTQTLDIIKSFPDKFSAEVLTAQNNADLLISQAIEFRPNTVVIGNENLYEKVNTTLSPYDIKVFAGSSSIEQIVKMSSIDMVLVALVGYSGLRPTYNALKHGKSVALANKETLVVAGNIITSLAVEKNIRIFPVDSEHSAIFQCLQGEMNNEVDKLILTASGGPFLGKKKEELTKIKPAEALNHPNWKMGNKVTIDSATLMNKGLEMIEAHWLFEMSPDKIEIIIHPQSIIHSMVQFTDHSIKAQLGVPDMRLPIIYALSYPFRLGNSLPEISFKDLHTLTFAEPDLETFSCLKLAYEALKKGGSYPCCMNAANEIAVEAFLKEKVQFLQIPDIIEKTMEKATYVSKPDIDTLIEIDKESRFIATQIVKKI